MAFDALTISAVVVAAVTIITIIKLVGLNNTKYDSDK